MGPSLRKLSCRSTQEVHLSTIIVAAAHIYLTVVFSLHVGKANTTALHYRVDYRRGYLVNLGDTINLTCPYTAPFYKWTPAAQASWILSEDQMYSLKADSLSVTGKYICSAVNGFGHNAAEFNIKVIDKFSPALKQNCALLSNGRVSDSGPCFLNIYSEAELSQLLAWGEDVNMDCESVAVEGLAERVAYTWIFHPFNPIDASPHLDELDTYPPFYPADRERPSHMVAKRESTELTPAEAVARFTGSTLRIKKITLAHAGEYQCSVNVDAKLGNLSGALAISKLSRTFRIRVQPRSEGEIIQGPHNITTTIEIGSDATFPCEINEEEHRSATIRWGKYVSLDESGTTDFRTSEVLHWSGGTYVVLPTILPQDLQQFFDIPKPLAVSNPGSRRSRLVLRSASPRDAGLYICSVITESGRDDHKFVHISLKDGNKVIEGMGDVRETTPRHLTIYIAVPICVFLVCICAVASVIIRNRSRLNRQRIQRNGQKAYFISQGMGVAGEKPSLNSSHRFLDHSSLAGSASMTFTRSGSPQRQGRSTVSSKVPPATHMQIRPSPMNSTTNTSTSQLQPTQFSPSHVQPSPYIYPSLTNECAYPSVESVPMRPPFTSPPIPAYGSPAYMNGHVSNVEFQRYPQVKGVSCSGYPQSGGSSACTTDIGLDQSGNPFITGTGSQCDPVNAQESQNRRFFCVSPSSGQENASHLQT
ncbi:Fibroblast growth factor receptor-like 1 [Taenia crassiceps]|uniref:Fibroblast growth factor receptor-like 1 n=1 Tax=Taenia crassiceps TaxID=6207 RepID=A0ABR4QN94_9CEST